MQGISSYYPYHPQGCLVLRLPALPTDCHLNGSLGLVLFITVFNVLLTLGFHPIVAGLYGVSQIFLFSVHRAGLGNLNFQISTIETQISFCLKQIVETAFRDHLKDKTVLMSVIAHVLIHIDRATFGAFSFLHGNLLSTI